MAGLAAGALPALAFAAAARDATPGGVLLKFLLMLLAAIAAHVLLARAAKWIASAVAPLASGEEEGVRYQRDVYGTADRGALEIVVLVLVAGVLMGLGATLAPSWLSALGAGLVVGAVVLDMMRWERASASANFVWFQRGYQRKLHQIAIENIRDVAVQEDEARGFTLLHGTRNRVCRVLLRLHDKTIVSLPRTDTARGLDHVEALANHVRARLQLLSERKSIERAERDSDMAPLAPEPMQSPEERALRQELKRVRRQARVADAIDTET